MFEVNWIEIHEYLKMLEEHAVVCANDLGFFLRVEHIGYAVIDSLRLNSQRA